MRRLARALKERWCRVVSVASAAVSSSCRSPGRASWAEARAGTFGTRFAIAPCCPLRPAEARAAPRSARLHPPAGPWACPRRPSAPSAWCPRGRWCRSARPPRRCPPDRSPAAPRVLPLGVSAGLGDFELVHCYCNRPGARRAYLHGAGDVLPVAMEWQSHHACHSAAVHTHADESLDGLKAAIHELFGAIQWIYQHAHGRRRHAPQRRRSRQPARRRHRCVCA
jgi:hypothetical protein